MTVSTPNSSNIKGFSYRNQRLVVNFKAGGSYAYENVPEFLVRKFESIATSGSAGKFFLQNIKNKFPYTRIK